MKLIQQLHDENPILLISPLKTEFDIGLKNLFSEFPTDIVSQKKLPDKLEGFSCIFIINPTLTNNEYKKLSLYKGKVCIINTTIIKELSILPNCKYVYTSVKAPTPDIAEKIMWFSLTDSTSNELNLDSALPLDSKNKKKHKFSFKTSKKRVVLIILLFFLLIEFFFIIPLLTSSIFLYEATRQFKNQDLEKTKQNLEKASPFISLTHNSYVISRPVLSFFFLALISDSLVDSVNLSHSLLQKGVETEELGRQTAGLILKSEKTPAEIYKTEKNLNLLSQNIEFMLKTTTSLSSKLENIPGKRTILAQKQLNTYSTTLDSAAQFLPFVKSALGGETEKKYALFFYNNMELRPGGGFIGSFGIVKFGNYSLKELTVYDVYDADGQLKTHIEPPKAISTYLNQTNWFLRDSNFSPDFPQNAKTAYSFLEQEMGITGFDGALGITSTGISNLLEAFGPIYLPDYKETITKDNFYIKTQLATEKNFFPGSSQKKDFLSTLMRMMILKFEDVSPTLLASEIQKNLSEKQMVFSFEDENMQSLIQKNGWSGQIILPQCATPAKSCRSSSIFPIDANLGVNKANFFIRRTMSVVTEFDKDQNINQTVEITFINDSPQDTYPGGTYKNFFRLFFPQDAVIESVNKDGKTISDWTKSNVAYFNVLSTYIELAPQTSTTLSIRYRQRAGAKKDLYQLAIQKQIGLLNTNVSLEFRAPPTIRLRAINFHSLEKSGRLLYNTHLSTDKLFVIELTN